MDRRTFLNTLLSFLGATALFSFGYPLLRFLAPPGSGAETHKLTVNKSDILPGESKSILVGSIPAIIINRADKGFIALSKVCTHLGCLVEYDKDKKRLQCPCHAGLFDLEGNVISGPPPKSLRKFPVKVEGDAVIIG
ncbi:MAG: ubiquinol-cytochrome c reductase iron-sulfur subunit [Nitrospirota bacterium]